MRDTSAIGPDAVAQSMAASYGPTSDSFLAGWCEQRRYEVKEVIGKGSYGVVCAATDHCTKERVAIKKIQNVFDNVADATRILREIKLLRLLKHPDVVEIKHIMLPPDPRTFKDIYVVFELLESDLHTVIGANDDLTQDHHKVFLYQLLRGLNFIHSSGVLHRDLKPKNILANSNCKLKICDFGLARPFLSDTAVSPVHWTDYVATRWYRAPELCGCFYGRYSQAVDIWSIGCIFAEVLLGKPLFPGRDAVSQLQLITDLLGKPPQRTIDRIGNQKARAFLYALAPKPAKDFKDKFPNATPAALALLQRLLAFDPADRPTAAEALADPYFASLPNATHQDPANYSRQQFDFELRKLDNAEVRALIYQEALTYHPVVAAAYQAQSYHLPLYAPLTVPGCDLDMRHQFKMAEQVGNLEVLAQQQAAQAAAAAAAAAQQQQQQRMQHMVQHSMCAPQSMPSSGVPLAMPAMSESHSMNSSMASTTALWYKQQQAHIMSSFGADMILTPEQQAAVLQFGSAQQLYQQRYASYQQQQAALAQAMGH